MLWRIWRENSLAENLQQIPGVKIARRRSTKKFVEKIDEGVVMDLRSLHKSFQSLENEIEKRCGEKIASGEMNIDDVFRPFCRSKGMRIAGVLDVQSVYELFGLLSKHYTFLDCSVLEEVVEQLPQSDDLLANMRSHRENVINFKRETPILHLKNKLQPFVRQAHLNEISFMVVFELEEAWGID